MLHPIPRIIIAALKGGSGKTMVSLGLVSVWRHMGHQVATFKKGPDFIDAGWLSFAAGRPCHNLDPFLMSEGQILRSFQQHAADTHIALIEGNRGLFDGLDIEGCCSTAELGRLTQSPVVVIVDVTMTTRTVAALIMGCQRFDPALQLAGVILNRVAGHRQETLIRNAIEQYCGIAVVGAIPKLKEDVFPERHMGLVPHQERDHAHKAIQWAGSVVERYVDLDTLWRAAHESRPIEKDPVVYEKQKSNPPISDSVRVGYIMDNAFWFYYPENLSQLKELGAELIEINAMKDAWIPDLDALYIGGGFPETQARVLADNGSFRTSLLERIKDGLPVYAECGGLIYLGEALHQGHNRFPMVNALPITFEMGQKPQGHGYTILEVNGENPYFPVGETIKGHEFHYSRPHITGSKDLSFAFEVKRGHGIDGQKDGICMQNLLATYTHIHAGGNRMWGEGFIQRARWFKDIEKKNA
ncbi:MAG: hydrogenobyrinic acid a,c-diamide synthase (glutamine-hydrolyzing) [Deltaproteobacteria bacterium]|nr:hydrogenobyrinic acid a,c-diamide synthase (glutamine-hydrolyzing) [Deltaproteobacteria bacterium]